MTALTSDRLVDLVGVEPEGFIAGTPALLNGGTQFYQGQLIMMGSDGLLAPATTGGRATGSVCVGVSQQTSILITSTNPLPLGYLSVRFGTVDMSNDSGNPVLSTTLLNTLLFAVDDNTVSLSSDGGLRAIAGRLRGFNSGDQFPVLVAVGLTPSGSTV